MIIIQCYLSNLKKSSVWYVNVANEFSTRPTRRTHVQAQVTRESLDDKDIREERNARLLDKKYDDYADRCKKCGLTCLVYDLEFNGFPTVCEVRIWEANKEIQ